MDPEGKKAGTIAKSGCNDDRSNDHVPHKKNPDYDSQEFLLLD
jgi:hypothetical protein